MAENGSMENYANFKAPGDVTTEIQAEKQEWQELVDMLRDKGLDDKDTHNALIAWIKGEEKNISDNIERQIFFSMKQAKLYEESGMTKEALLELNDAANGAFGAGKDDLLQEIDAKFVKLEGIIIKKYWDNLNRINNEIYAKRLDTAYLSYAFNSLKDDLVALGEQQEDNPDSDEKAELRRQIIEKIREIEELLLEVR